MKLFFDSLRTVFGMIRRDAILLAPSLVLVSVGMAVEFFKLRSVGTGLSVAPGFLWWVLEFLGMTLILQNGVFVLSVVAGLDVFHDTEIDLSSVLKRIKRPFMRMGLFVFGIMVVLGPFMFPGSGARGVLDSVLGNTVSMGILVAGVFFVVLFLMFTPFAIVVEGVSVKQAILTSFLLVRGHFREVVGFVFFQVIFVFSFLILTISVMGAFGSGSDLSMIATAWFVLVMGILQAVIWFLNLVFFVTCRINSDLTSR